MMEKESTTLDGSAFARVLGRLMEAHLPRTPDEEKALELAEWSGYDVEVFRARLHGDPNANLVDLSSLAYELHLSEPERQALATSYTYEREPSPEEWASILGEGRTTRALGDVIEDALGIVYNLGEGVAYCATCGGEAVRCVYRLPYCDRHGEDCEAGAVRMFWDDAHYAGERLQTILEDLIPLWSNELADKLYGDAVREAMRRARAQNDDSHEAEARVGLHREPGAPVPGVERGEVDHHDYSEWDRAHFHIHHLMRKGFEDNAPDEVLYGLERERADVVRKIQAAHDWTPGD